MTGFEIGFALMATLVGSFFAFVGWGMLRTERDRDTRGVVTRGTITGSRWSSPAGDTLVGRPVVEFIDHSGQRRTFVHSAGTNAEPKKGRTVQVWYDPDRPDEDPVLYREGVATMAPVLFLVVGAITLVVMVFSVTVMLRNG